jgi:hypothetical protein
MIKHIGELKNNMLRDSFYNTTSETGQTLIDFTNKAGAQDIIILDFFQVNKGKSFTAWEVTDKLKEQGHEILFTSVRRSITTLSKSFLVRNTGEKVIGKYNRPCLKWTLK